MIRIRMASGANFEREDIMDKDAIRKAIDCKTACKIALVGFADDFSSEIAELEAQLAEAEKPKLRYGDVRYYGGRRTAPVVYVGGRWFNAATELRVPLSVAECEKLPTEFNIFDDLKALAEPLETFEMDCRCNPEDKLQVAICGGCPNGNDIRFSINGSGLSIHVPLEDISKLILNLCRMKATVEKAKNGKRGKI